MPPLQQRLILNRFFCRLFGLDDFKGLRGQLHNVQQGYAEDGHSYFYHTFGDQARRRPERAGGHLRPEQPLRPPPVSTAAGTRRARFIADLRNYLHGNDERFAGKEVFLLRNLTRGRGLCFFEASEGESFYPDFIFV